LLGYFTSIFRGGFFAMTSTNWTNTSVNSTDYTGTSVNSTDYSATTVNSTDFTDESVISNDYGDGYTYILANDTTVQANSTAYDARGLLGGTNKDNSTDWT